MALRIMPLECLPKGTIRREQLKAEMERAKTNPASAPTHFLCRTCCQSTPVTEVGRRHASGWAECKACYAKTKANVAADARRRKGKTRRGARKIRPAHLPLWMFS